MRSFANLIDLMDIYSLSRVKKYTFPKVPSQVVEVNERGLIMLFPIFLELSENYEEKL